MNEIAKSRVGWTLCQENAGRMLQPNKDRLALS